MRKVKEKTKPSTGKDEDNKKQKARRPAGARSANLGFHGRDDERSLNPEE